MSRQKASTSCAECCADLGAEPGPNIAVQTSRKTCVQNVAEWLHFEGRLGYNNVVVGLKMFDWDIIRPDAPIETGAAA